MTKYFKLLFYIIIFITFIDCHEIISAKSFRPEKEQILKALNEAKGLHILNSKKELGLKYEKISNLNQEKIFFNNLKINSKTPCFYYLTINQKKIKITGFSKNIFSLGNEIELERLYGLKNIELEKLVGYVYQYEGEMKRVKWTAPHLQFNSNLTFNTKPLADYLITLIYKNGEKKAIKKRSFKKRKSIYKNIIYRHTPIEFDGRIILIEDTYNNGYYFNIFYN